ncbi:MAG TPA: flagellin [Candidatus Latescibacteria bacterium]|nr:flagellin [Gemmatimonadota bacterium]HCR19378.1 flagellin [Candidatus Latescibacterota bacterium]|tara:strand:- start:59 stop:1246 length:1188 start_codon:yes stop_codon:yes gene_type:complete
MPLRINTNIPAINVRRILSVNNKDLKTRIERLSSGFRINRAADDAAGLNVSEGMRAEIIGLRQAVRNAEQATNLIQTAEGALNEVNAILIRMRELSVQSASSTVNDDNRGSINAEYIQLINEIDRIGSVTSYNNSTLLAGYGNIVDKDEATSDALASATTGAVAVQISGAAAGTYTFTDDVANEITLGNGIATQTIDIGAALDLDDVGGVVATGSSIVANFDRLGIQLTLTGQRDVNGSTPLSDGYRDTDLEAKVLVINSGTGGTFQVGPRDGANHRIEINVADMRASSANLNLGSSSVSSLSSAQSAITSLDLAINRVANQRGDLGAFQNRLAFNVRVNETAVENIQASESFIRDADVASEISAFTRAQILVQSGTALLAQANVLPQNALSLLG